MQRIEKTVAWLAFATLAASLAGFAGDFAWWLGLFEHFHIQYALGGAALLVAALWFRRWWAAGVVMTALAINIALTGPALFPAGPSGARANVPSDFKVMTANLLYRNPDIGLVEKLVAAERPDVIAFQEVNWNWEERLAAIAEDYPYRIGRVIDKAYGIALFSRRPWKDVRIVFDPGSRLLSAVARFEVDGEPLTVIGTHVQRPGSAGREAWRAGNVSVLADLAREANGGVVVMGDFNSTPWSRTFRRISERGGVGLGGAGALPSWPNPLPELLRIPIDHILVNPGIEVVDKHLGPGVGSDHLPLIAELRFNHR